MDPSPQALMSGTGRKKRGPSHGKKVRNRPAEDRKIKFKENGTPTGPSKSEFTNHVSYMVRDRVPCSIKSWALVDVKLKWAIWEDIKSFWNITDDNLKKKIIKYMGERWKAWKTRLRKNFLKDVDPENPKLPWQHGYHVEAEHWEAFQAYVASEAFQSLSAIGKLNASKHFHPHRLGSGGYETALLNWKATDVVSMGDSATVINSETDDRSFTWLRARAIPTEQDGVFIIPNEATQEVLQKVGLFSQQVSEGLFHPVRHNDVLTTSIGTPEHPERVRGCSGFVGIKGAFGNGSRRTLHANCFTEPVVQRLIQVAIQQALQAQEAQYHQNMTEVLRQANLIPPPNAFSPEGSRPHTQVNSCNGPSPHHSPSPCHSPPLHHSPPPCQSPAPIVNMQPVPCNILATIEGRGRVMVAHGRLPSAGPGGTVHHESLRADQLRVGVDKVLDGFDQLRLPFSNEEQQVLGDSAGGFVKWPANLVERCDQDLIAEKNVDSHNDKEINGEKEKGNEINGGTEEGKKGNGETEKRKTNFENQKGKDKVPSATSAFCPPLLLDDAFVQRLGKPSKFLYNILLTLGDGAIEIGNMGIFGLNDEDTLWLLREDVIEVFKNESLSISVLQAFCLTCQERLNQYYSNRFFFLDPFTLSFIQMGKGLDKPTKYLVSFFNRVEDKSSLILLPYLESGHWVLVVVQLSTRNCYIVDSLVRDYAQEPLYIQATLAAALNLYLVDQPKIAGPRRSSKFNWRVLGSPKQVGTTMCGYYVMKVMYDLTSKFAGSNTMPAKLHPAAPKPYPICEIEEVKDFLLNFIRRKAC